MLLRHANLQVYEKNYFIILFHVSCLHFLRIHLDYFFRRGFKSVRAQFFLAESSVICNVPVQSRLT